MASRRDMQLLVVRALNAMCVAVDAVAYRPLVVKLTERLPRWWRCELARLSMTLDDRWGVGYWASDMAPAAPRGLCDACGRRPAWVVVGGADLGGSEDERTARDDYLAGRSVNACGWCRLDVASPLRNEQDLKRVLREARERSVSWTWSC